MPDDGAPEFAIHVPPLPPADPAARRSREDRVLGLRGKLEYYYGEFKRLEKKAGTERLDVVSRESKILLDLIQVVDSFEDVLRIFKENKKLRKLKDAVAYFQTTYETALHVLEKWDVHRVPIEGQRYTTVEFRGVNIPAPWEVVGTSGGEKDKAVSKVLRSLWVRILDDRLIVLRRAQVVY